jgi:hypothetical protein
MKFVFLKEIITDYDFFEEKNQIVKKTTKVKREKATRKSLRR